MTGIVATPAPARDRGTARPHAGVDHPSPMTMTAPSDECLLQCPDEAATEALGAALAAALLDLGLPGLLLTLRGDLGAGKTTLVRAILRALGVRGRIKSPSYALVEPYAIEQNRLELKRNQQKNAYHVDLYRFSDPDEWDDAGLRELLDGDSLCLVEWPEHAPALLPRADLDIALHAAGDGRTVTLRSGSPLGHAVLQRLAPAAKGD